MLIDLIWNISCFLPFFIFRQKKLKHINNNFDQQMDGKHLLPVKVHNIKLLTRYALHLVLIHFINKILTIFINLTPPYSLHITPKNYLVGPGLEPQTHKKDESSNTQHLHIHLFITSHNPHKTRQGNDVPRNNHEYFILSLSLLFLM